MIFVGAIKKIYKFQEVLHEQGYHQLNFAGAGA
jgi:hypothetical protein